MIKVIGNMKKEILMKYNEVIIHRNGMYKGFHTVSVLSLRNTGFINVTRKFVSICLLTSKYALYLKRSPVRGTTAPK